jgi:hypothetical protein
VSAGERPVWLLDVDGVLNAIATQPDRTVWPADQWLRTTAEAQGSDWPILAARPVLDLIREVHEQGLAEVRWHTTWQQHAVKTLAPALDLPEFPVQDDLGAVDGYFDDESGTVRYRWWKRPAAEHVVQVEGRRLIWTDDDISTHRSQLDALAEHLLIAPQTRLGLTPRHLRQIREHLDMEAN